MKNCMKLLLLAASVALCACSIIPLPGDPPAHKVSLDGETYLLKQITESTWTVNSTGSMQTLAASAASTASLRKAVEITSGCKVTDSDYSRQGRQFDAQVDCVSKMAN